MSATIDPKSAAFVGRNANGELSFLSAAANDEARDCCTQSFVRFADSDPRRETTSSTGALEYVSGGERAAGEGPARCALAPSAYWLAAYEAVDKFRSVLETRAFQELDGLYRRCMIEKYK